MSIIHVRMNTKSRGLIARALFALVIGAPLGAQQTLPPKQERPAVEDGAQLFKTWCASCHGLTAQGNGPVAPLMKHPVPDLTQLAAHNGGVFPSARIRRIVDGRDVASHGDREMPVWGTAFQTSKEGLTEAVARARIDAIVAYLEGIQNRNAH